MKLNKNISKEKVFYQNKTNIIDNFWDDCIDLNKLKNNNDLNTNRILVKKKTLKLAPICNLQYTSKINKISRTKSNKSNTSRSCNDKIIEKLCINNPDIYKEFEEEANKKKRTKNSIIRCLGLYAYGMELKNMKKKTKDENEKLKIKEEIELCTWKPKLNKIKKNEKEKIKSLGSTIYIRDKNRKKLKNSKTNIIFQNDINFDDEFHKTKFKGNKLNNLNNFDYNLYLEQKQKERIDSECTFKPKINDNNLTYKLFNNNNSLYNDKENAQFILRYTKARDEHMIKRFKKLSHKDDSYDNSLIALTTRLCSKEYKYYLNVNNNIDAYGDSCIKFQSQEMLNSSIGNFNFKDSYSPIKCKLPCNKSKKHYITTLRKNLQNLDLNQNDDINSIKNDINYKYRNKSN